jgi:hypothetical protein
MGTHGSEGTWSLPPSMQAMQEILPRNRKKSQDQKEVE